MLTNLKILNGQLSPDFDIYNNIYTVNITEDIDALDIEYELIDDNTIVNIFGNDNLKIGENQVIINIVGSEEKNIYLTVNKVKETVSYIDSYGSFLEVEPKEEAPIYMGPLIGSVCFILILISFALIFRKSKK